MEFIRRARQRIFRTDKQAESSLQTVSGPADEPAECRSANDPVVSIFISHAHEDKDDAHRLTAALDREGIKPWLDAQELRVGDQLLHNIAQVLASVDYFALILTRVAMTKNWVLAEARMALTREIEAGRPKVLVLLWDECEIPAELETKLYLDFRGRFDSALAELVAGMKNADLSIAPPKQITLAEIIAGADAELWERFQAGAGPEDEWNQAEAANLIRGLRQDELEAAVAIGRQSTGYEIGEGELVARVRGTVGASEAGAHRIINRLAEHGFLNAVTDLDYSRERVWRYGGITWILQRAARRSGLFPELGLALPDRLSSLLAYRGPVLITGKGWYAERFEEPLITGVDPAQPAIVGVSRLTDPGRSWVLRSSNDRLPLVADRFFPLGELVPERLTLEGLRAGKWHKREHVWVGFDLPTFDDLDLLHG